MYKIKPFTQFLNEFEIEGQLQKLNLHYYVLQKRNGRQFIVTTIDTDDMNEQFPDYIITKVTYKQALKDLYKQIWSYWDNTNKKYYEFELLSKKIGKELED